MSAREDARGEPSGGEPSRDERVVGALLRAGLALAAVLMLGGVVVGMVSGETAAPAVPLFSVLGPAVAPGDRLTALGALALALTPALRVVALIVVWIREHDLRFAAVAALVAVLLVIAAALGGG